MGGVIQVNPKDKAQDKPQVAPQKPTKVKINQKKIEESDDSSKLGSDSSLEFVMEDSSQRGTITAMNPKPEDIVKAKKTKSKNKKGLKVKTDKKGKKGTIERSPTKK